LGVRLTSPRKRVEVEKTSEMLRRGSINRRRSGYKEKEDGDQQKAEKNGGVS
jgi:hypothetical protein